MHREARGTRYCITIESSLMRAIRGKQSAVVKKAKATLLLYGFCLFDFKKLRLDFVPVDEDWKVLLDPQDHGTQRKGKGSLKKSHKEKRVRKKGSGDLRATFHMVTNLSPLGHFSLKQVLPLSLKNIAIVE